MVAAKLDKLLFYRVEYRAEGIDGGLERRVRLVELEVSSVAMMALRLMPVR